MINTMESSSRRTNQRRRWIQRGCTSLVLSMAVTLLLLDLTHAFGILHLTTSNSGRYPMRLFMSETIETVGGQNMCAIVDDFVDAQMKWMAAAGTNEDGDDPNLNESDNSFVSWEHLILSEDVSPMSPPLTYQKFVTMQSRRVPVTIRYSADSGMKPYFLTVAKKLKETHPDIILDKAILPKIVAGDGKPDTCPTFEVMVDGKVIIPTVGKKDRVVGSASKIVFVSMVELDTAIARARRRRRPSTVYGDDEGNIRLEMLKAKAAAAKVATPFE